MAISIKSRNEFITQIFGFFRTERTNSLFNTYDIALTTKYSVDWEAFYENVIKTAEKRILPVPKYFADNVKRFKIVQSESNISNESIIRIELMNDYYYDFTVNNVIDCRSLKEIKKRFEYKDENNRTKNEIKRIVWYPKETTLIGKDVFFNISIPRKSNMSDEEKEKFIAEKEKELKQQVKTLYLASA